MRKGSTLTRLVEAEDVLGAAVDGSLSVGLPDGGEHDRQIVELRNERNATGETSRVGHPVVGEANVGVSNEWSDQARIVVG